MGNGSPANSPEPISANSNELDQDFLLNCSSKDHSLLIEGLNELLKLCEEEQRERIETLIELVDDFNPTD